MKLTDVLSQITYEGDSSLKIGEDGTLVSTTEPSPTPTPMAEPVTAPLTLITPSLASTRLLAASKEFVTVFPVTLTVPRILTVPSL